MRSGDSSWGRPTRRGRTRGRLFLPWLLLIAVAFLIPVMCMQLYSVKLVDPARVSILFQSEVIFGLASAAALTAEPFGWKESVGAALVIAASLTEVVFNRSGSAQAPAES